MNKTKFYTIGLVAGSLFATSCDDRVDCGCDCNMPTFEKWEMLKPGEEKSADGTVSSGNAIVVWGKNLSDITAISFGGKNAELHPAYMEDNKIVFQVPENISKNCVAHVTTASCEQGFDVDMLSVVVAPPCVAMCDNEMAEKTLKIVGNSFFAPLKALFLDKDGNHTLEASTDNGMITIDDPNHATIKIPSGVAPSGRIKFVSDAGESESNFIFRDTRNMLITLDDPDYLDLFNQDKPDAELDSKPALVSEGGVLHTENNTSNFAVFWNNGYTIWTYAPTGPANPEGKPAPALTPFGVFSESISKHETTYNDYVIKFEVFVPKSNPINGNGLAIGFFGDNPWDGDEGIRAYCAFWQPSKATYAKDKDNVWLTPPTCEDWNSGGDWLTVTIPMDEVKYDFGRASYTHCAQDNRLGAGDEVYKGFGDKEKGLAFFDNDWYSNADPLNEDDAMYFQGLGMIFGSDDQPNKGYNKQLIAIDNLRITPKDNNGGVWPLLKWGQSTRDFYNNPITSCNK